MANWNENVLRNPDLRNKLTDVFEGTTAIKPALQDVTPVNAVASTGTLTVGAQPTAGDTMTIGSTVYTFVADGTAASAGEINVGADLADAKVEILASVNGTNAFNDVNPEATLGAFSTDDSTVTATVKGATTGDAIATTETFDSASNSFAAVTLGSGVDGTVGTAGQIVADSSYLYVCVAANTIAGANWRRTTLGSAY